MSMYNVVFSALSKFGLTFDGAGQMTFKGAIVASGGVVGPLGKGIAFYLDAANGSNNNNGRTPTTAFATLAYAYTKLTANRNDTLFYIAGATSITLASTLTWAKNYTHLIGVCAPTGINQRARLFATNAMVTMLSITATGCIFKNIYINQGGNDATDLNCVLVSGGRNYFENVHFAGMGNATPADETGASSLALVGAEENTFVNCTIGLDTIDRSTTNAELDIRSSSVRNVFRNCLFLSRADNNGHLFVKIDTVADLDRFVIFDNCMFINCIESGATLMLQAMSVHDAAAGLVILKQCLLLGATNWCVADNGNVYADNAFATLT
ncbi:hypothetical protein LCGC14_2460960, partial [marine sediment metagenome]